MTNTKYRIYVKNKKDKSGILVNIVDSKDKAYKLFIKIIKSGRDCNVLNSNNDIEFYN